MLCKSQVLPDVLQVIFTTACELVTPKHVVPGTLKILQGQLQFTGDLLPEEGLSNSPQDGPASKPKVKTLCMAYEQASFLHVRCQKTACLCTVQFLSDSGLQGFIAEPIAHQTAYLT